MSKINQMLTASPYSATVKVENTSSILAAFVQQVSAAKHVVWHLPPIANSPAVAITNEVIGRTVISKKLELQNVDNHQK